MTVTNNDASSCSPASFNLAASVLSGWSAAFANPSHTLNPGASASTTVTLTSGSLSPAGAYTVTLSASNSAIPGYSASTAVTYEVALNVAVSTNNASYALGSTVTITTMVTSGSSPVSGAGVTFTITKPNGSPVTGTATTGANGAASYVYKLRRNSPTGTWRAAGTASTSAASGSGAAVFSVQ